MIRALIACLLLGAVLGQWPQEGLKDPKPFGDGPFEHRGSDAELSIELSDIDAKSYRLLPPGSYNFNSMNYPNNYPNSKTKMVTLVGLQYQVITISCSSFDVQESEGCVNDFLSVNGQRYCGRLGPYVSSHVLTIVCHSDDTVTRPGFACTVTVPGPTTGA